MTSNVYCAEVIDRQKLFLLQFFKLFRVWPEFIHAETSAVVVHVINLPTEHINSIKVGSTLATNKGLSNQPELKYYYI